LTLPVPDRLAVAVRHRDPAQAADGGAVDAGGAAGHERARGSLVEGGELVGEPGHGAADAGAPGGHAAAQVVDRAALGYVALDHRAPAAEVDQALLVALLLGEGSLLVVARPHAVAMDRVLEEPGRAAQIVELGQRPDALQEEEHGADGLGEVV